jgi:signal transduction histidine kinase
MSKIVVTDSRDIQKDTRAADSLVGGGEMGKVVRSMDWTKTPLGPIESWPQSLCTTVSLCLASNFPISLAWGPKHVQIYNDGYWPICGGKHPNSMGQDFSECWASAWPVIGDAFERALTGETSYLANQRMFLDRNGYLEETFFTFSFSPIHDESGGVGGLFHPVTETTAEMVGERRMRALRDLVARAGKAKTSEEALALAAQTLSEFELDIPFVMFYLVDFDRMEAQLIARTAALPDHIAIPMVDLKASRPSLWPLAEVACTNQPLRVDDLETQLGSCGPYPEGPKTALVLPITPPGCELPTAILVGGVSPRLALNDTYRAYYDMVVAAVTSALTNARAYQEERKRADALAEIDRAKTAFFSNVSHEFRTPLTLMLGPLEEELGEVGSSIPSVRRERLNMAHRNALRLLKLVNTLLDFSSLESGRIQASYEATDLATCTAELASVFRSAIEKGGLTLTVDCPPLPELVYIDREMWEKVVLNLLSNAFKHTFTGGIHVSLGWRDDYAELAVMDSGVGIPEAELPFLFDRFHQVKGANSRTHEGTGIGLTLVQELIRMHGGTVRVESQEGKGSTFTATVKTGQAHLPAGRLGAQRSHASTATRADAYTKEALSWITDITTASKPLSPPVETADGSSLREVTPAPIAARPRILWADDNADMREYVRRLLGERYDVTTVSDGTTALAAALATPPDLVLTDVMMSGQDGFSLLRELRAAERTRSIPVILLSARAGTESAVEGLEAGADDYLVKPFSARELLARIATHLKMAKLRRERALELEGMVQERTAELQKSLRDLALSNKNLEQSKEIAETANKTKSLFLANMSHELRTPLNAILGYSEMLQEEAVELQLVSGFGVDLKKINRAGKHLLALINDILDLSKIEAGKMGLFLENFDLAETIEEVASTILPMAEKNANKLHIQCAPDLGAMYADQIKVRQALLNLLSNAAKFTYQGNITLEADRQSLDGREWILFRVTDTGIGLSSEQIAKIFSSFTQGDASITRNFGGTGLGLVLSRHFCQMMGGDVTVRSVVEEGSVFTIKLPSVVSEETAESLPEGGEEIAEPLPPDASCVLVIDDDLTQRDLIERFLKKEGFSIRAAAKGVAGLRLARQLLPAAIILDVRMPGMDGWKVLSALKADPNLCDIPVIMVTVIDDPAKGFALGAAEFFVKPMDRAHLVQILKKLCGDRMTRPAPMGVCEPED